MLPGDDPADLAAVTCATEGEQIDGAAQHAAADDLDARAPARLCAGRQVELALQRIGRPARIPALVAQRHVLEDVVGALDPARDAPPVAAVVRHVGAGAGPAVFVGVAAGEPGRCVAPHVEDPEAAAAPTHARCAEEVVADGQLVRTRVADQPQLHVGRIGGGDDLDAAARNGGADDDGACAGRAHCNSYFMMRPCRPDRSRSRS